MDPMVAQKLVELSTNVNNLNVQVAALTDAIGALVRHLEEGGLAIQHGAPQMQSPVQQVGLISSSLASMARHWQRSQMAQASQPQVMPGPGPGVGFDGS